jgi:hypothetical protein
VKLSKPQLGSSARFSACEKLVHEIRLLSERINKALSLIDPTAYDAHVLLRQKLIEKFPFAKGRASIDPTLFQGRSVIYNRQTPNHLDGRDPTIGWTPLFVTGEFTGGGLRIRRLGLRMSFTPGTCIFLRGRVLPHEIEVFGGGQRVSIAHFCHQSVWAEMGVTLASSAL